MAYEPPKIVERGPAQASLQVTRKCGHRVSLSYGGKAFAQADIASQEASVCQPCHNAAIVKALKEKSNAK